MIPGLREIVASLYGSWRLAHFDRGGMAYFDKTVEGFWRSFFAAVLVAPLFAIMLGLRYSAEGALAEPVHYGILAAMSYLISWFAYPVVILALSESLDCRDRFVGYIVAYNWSMVLQNAVLIPLGILNALHVFGPDIGTLVWLAAIVLITVYLWFIARAGLGVPALTAVGIVAIDILLSLVIDAVTDSLR